MADSNAGAAVRDFIYLDSERVPSLGAQLEVGVPGEAERVQAERMFLAVEAAVEKRGNVLEIGEGFDFAKWRPETFADGQFFRATGLVRILDYTWLAMALSGLPAVLRKMSKMEMEALKSSEEGKRMSKSQFQQRQQENIAAIQKVEEFKADELGDIVRKLYGDVVRIKVRPSAEQPAAVLIGSGYARHFYDTPAAISQKYGIEIDAGWTVFGQINMPRKGGPASPIPIGNKMEDAFEQIALLMNNALRLADSPAFPTVSFTPVGVYRRVAGSE
jgi:hypothetical protein